MLENCPALHARAREREAQEVTVLIEFWQLLLSYLCACVCICVLCQLFKRLLSLDKPCNILVTVQFRISFSSLFHLLPLLLLLLLLLLPYSRCQ